MNLVDVVEKGINPFLGLARAKAVQFTIDNTVYLGLGKNSDSIFNDFWKYTPTTDEWTRIASFPGEARSGAVAFALGNKGYVGLGYIEGGWDPDTYFNDFYSYNPQNNTWTKVADFAGTARGEAVSFVIGDTAYVGTGTDANGQTKDFWKYTAQQNRWTAISAFTGDKRTSATAFVVNGKGYVTGGFYVDDYSNQLSDMQEYDPATGKWTEKIFADGILLSFNNAAAIGLGNKGFICYGTKKKVVSYSPSTNTVNDLGDILSLSNERMDPVVFQLGDLVYFGTGYYGLWTTTYTNDMLTLSLPINYGPTDILLSNTSVEENLYGAVVGTLNSTDRSATDQFTYELVAGEGSDDNYNFQIDNDQLKSFFQDYEVKNSLSVRIRTTDSENEWFEKAFTISVTNVNEAPENITLSSDTADSEMAIGTTIGVFSCEDPDNDDSHTFSLLAQNDYSFYQIEGNELRLNQIIENAPAEHYLSVKATDAGGLSVTNYFTIHVKKGSGIGEFNQVNPLFSIYPNPAKSYLMVESLDVNRPLQQVDIRF
jgi:hypothetical protein